MFWGVGFGTIFKSVSKGLGPSKVEYSGGAGFGIISRSFLKGVGLKGRIFGPFSRSFSKGWGPQRLNILGVALGPFSRTVKMLGASKVECILGGGFRGIFIKGSMFKNF